MMSTDDRRRRRSSDPLVALHYQLSHAKSEERLEAIVVADESGVVVAAAGAWAACEELAAYAPLLAQGGWSEPGCVQPSRLAEIRSRSDVQTVEIGDQEVLLCAMGGTRGRSLDKAARGVVRILGASA